MNARERAVLEALLPSGAHPDLPWGLFEAGFEEFHRGFEREAAWTMRLGFKAALWVAVWVSPVLIGRLPPFTRLTPADRERALEAMERSPHYALRQLLVVLKAVCAFSYGAADPVRRAIGFPEQASTRP